ncbi:MAG: aminotransferase class I/II-fold pyridoxal phosphate-dependent enzyme [Phycisphaerales bacterium]
MTQHRSQPSPQPKSQPTPQLADRFAPFGTTIFAEMTALANTHNAVNLSQGFPDFDGPDLGKLAAQRAIADGHNQYAPLPGMMSLRESIARWSQDFNNLACDPATEITVTSGCTEAIAASFLGLVNPGDEVILFEPYYDSYRACVAMAGATAKFVPIEPGLNGASGFTFDPEKLRNAFSSKTRVILVNTPHNPTGMVFDRNQLAQVAELCIKHDVLAFSDEVYERLTYDGCEHTSIATLPNMRERTVVMSSLGKTFSLTGWKIGWTIAPPPLTAGIRSAHQFLTFSVPGPLQLGASALLDDSRDEIQRVKTHYTQTKDLLAEALTDLGFQVHLPQGAYFIMAEHQPVSERLGLTTDVDLCKWLPEHAGVAAIPPSVFYNTPSLGEGFVRFAFCKQMSTIQSAITRLRSAINP